MDSLQNISMESASMRDLLAAAIGTDAAPSHSAYQVDGTDATLASAGSAADFLLDNKIDGGDADDYLDRSRSERVKRITPRAP